MTKKLSSCSVVGCINIGRLIRGWCKLHYQHWYRNGSPIETHHDMHGGHDKPEYRIWDTMRQRCSNPNNNSYARYGARGIKVCPEWDRSFASFIKDMGDRPNAGYTLDRIDNNGNYEPSNCRWATHREQANNRSSNRWVMFRGENRTLAQWARAVGLTPAQLNNRVFKHGWSIDRALTTKLIVRGR